VGLIDSKNSGLVSIIVPCKAAGPLLEKCVEAIEELDYNRVETIVLPDASLSRGLVNASVIPTGPLGPAHKRDIGARAAKGEILAFIDDDAYPAADWLSRATDLFDNPEIVAVGGPGVTPLSDGLLEQGSGWVYSSWLGGGGYRYRVVPQQARWVDDFPSMNFLVRSDAFFRAGGFDTHFYPGEDTKLCLALIQDGGKIRYDPNVLVYHHRRPLFWPHLRQILQYGIHRGHFARKYPRTSLRVSYFLPSVWIMGLIVGPLLLQGLGPLWLLYRIVVALYGAALIVTFLDILIRARQPALSLLAVAGIVLTHFVYGVGFVRGLWARSLER